MTQIKNTSKVDQPFVTGADKVESVAPGETKSINVPENRPDVVGRLHAGVIEIVNGKPAKSPEPKVPESKTPAS